MSKILATCLDCGTPIRERATTLNAVPHCGWSALGCAHFHGDDPRRTSGLHISRAYRVAHVRVYTHVVAGDAASRRRGSSWPPNHSSRASGCTSGDLARDLLQEAFQAAIALSVSIAYFWIPELMKCRSGNAFQRMVQTTESIWRGSNIRLPLVAAPAGRIRPVISRPAKAI